MRALTATDLSAAGDGSAQHQVGGRFGGSMARGQWCPSHGRGWAPGCHGATLNTASQKGVMVFLHGGGHTKPWAWSGWTSRVAGRDSMVVFGADGGAGKSRAKFLSCYASSKSGRGVVHRRLFCTMPRADRGFARVERGLGEPGEQIRDPTRRAAAAVAATMMGGGP